MNKLLLDDNAEVTFQFSGQMTINRQVLKGFLSELIPTNSPAAPTQAVQVVPEPTLKPQRLAYTIKETALILGVSYKTVHRLIQRRLLKSSLALRCKIIPLSEIERFLKETL
ncbi:MAG: helix-turn-helix domain-containing protein [Verrucomicrobiota bacterium]